MFSGKRPLFSPISQPNPVDFCYYLIDSNDFSCDIGSIRSPYFPRNCVCAKSITYLVSVVKAKSCELCVLVSICIPASVEIIRTSCFSTFNRLSHFAFESGSRLQKTEKKCICRLFSPSIYLYSHVSPSSAEQLFFTLSLARQFDI
jgi:hypothetical protein